MRALLTVLVVLLVATARASADTELCDRGARYRGAPIDLDVKDAELQVVFRALADTANLNIVLGDKVSGKVTLRLKRVPWDQVACTIAAMKQLAITLHGNVLLVVPRT